jgi:hypothetical protein
LKLNNLSPFFTKPSTPPNLCFVSMQSQPPLIQLPVDHLDRHLTSTVPQGDYSQELVNNNPSNNPGNNAAKHAANNTATTATNGANEPDDKVRRPRSKWTQEETDDLIKGCAAHGVGNWKKCATRWCSC